ncbi:MAG: type II toxin-antitoxin system RelE/ParE family toxin [Candidatus Acidiferrales bacterium]
MRVFKTKTFTRFARKTRLSDAALCRAIVDAERGLIDADLGGGVIKQRFARRGQGKSGGFRVVILYQRGVKAFFVYGFAKSERGNIAQDELAALKELATEMLGYDETEIAQAMASGPLIEVNCNE